MEFAKSEKVAVERLRLDRQNPRLIGEGENASEEFIIGRLYRSADLGELLQSISANGYMDIEPLIVMPDPQSKEGNLIVLEGNRRLAALRLLREPELVSKIKQSEKLPITIPAIGEQQRSTLDIVSVYPVPDREAARSFIGFKHINGPAKWDAYAKAQFAAEWYKLGRDKGINLELIANAIGDRHNTIKRMVFAIYILEQAKKQDLFDIEDRYTTKLNFSHLYTALARSEYMKYLGLDVTWVRHDPEPNQVAPEKLEELRNILIWIYGSKKDDREPVIKSQNPDIKRLGQVIAHAEGRHVLETKGNLDDAYTRTESEDRRFAGALIRAQDNIRDAAGLLSSYDGKNQSLLKVAEVTRKTARIVHEYMFNEYETRDDS